MAHRRVFLFIAGSCLVLMLGGCAHPHRTPAEEEQEPTYLETSSPSGTHTAGIYHTISRGETLWRIAKTYGVDLQTLAELNNIDDPARIQVGQSVFVPGASATKPIPADSKEPPPPTARPILFRNDFIWPVQGKLASTFGMHNGLRYEGIDIVAPLGTPVKASKGGEVVYEGCVKGYGKVVILSHENRFNTVYAYNQANLVKVGRKVQKGEIIAQVGMSGRSSDPCLHFQVRDSNQARNPLFFLP